MKYPLVARSSSDPCSSSSNTVVPSREETLSPAVSGSDESTDTLTPACNSTKKHLRLGTNTESLICRKISQSKQEEEFPAMESAESFAGSLMDHFTEKGLLAKEIKVAEIVEIPLTCSSPWNTSEESLYSFYDDEFAQLTIADIVDVSGNADVEEYVSFSPYSAGPSVTLASAQITQEDPYDLKVPTMQEQPIFFGNAYPIEFIVQDFDNLPNLDSPQVARASFEDNREFFQPFRSPNASIVPFLETLPSPMPNPMGRTQYSQAIGIDMSKDTDSGCSVTTCSDQADDFRHHHHHRSIHHQHQLPNQHHHSHQTPNQFFVEELKEPVQRMKHKLFPSTSLSSDENEMGQPGQMRKHNLNYQTNQDRSQVWSLETFSEDENTARNSQEFENKNKKLWNNSEVIYSKADERLVDLDWEMLDPTSCDGSHKILNFNMGQFRHTEKCNTFPKVSSNDPKTLKSLEHYVNISNDDFDSDHSTAHEILHRKTGRAENTFGRSPRRYRSSDFGDYSADEDEIIFEPDTATIQDAIRRQYNHSPISTSDSPGPTKVLSTSVEESEDRFGNLGNSSKKKNDFRMMAPLRNVTSMPVLDPKFLPPHNILKPHIVRLPRGRHPLRGPFGQMLDAQMSKNNSSKFKQYNNNNSNANSNSSEEGIPPLHNEHWKNNQNEEQHQVWLQKTGFKPISTINHDNNGSSSSINVSHSRTMSTPSEHEFIRTEHVRTCSTPAEVVGPPEDRGENPVNKNQNFADLSQDKLTVHQELLVARNPRRETSELNVGGGGGVTIGKSGSFRRRKETRTLIVKELYNVEKSYVESLQFLIMKYYKPLKTQDKNQIVSNVLVDDIFFQIPQICGHHETFLKDLKDRLENWDAKKTIGDWFLDSFSSKAVIDTYTAFIRNVKRADEAIRISRQTKPAFDRFLQEMRRERKGERLSLTDLLAKPHQRIPRYRLLIQRLLEHTEPDHLDYPLLKKAEREIHEIALKISVIQKETHEQENRLKVLRQLELSIQGLSLNDLRSATRSLIQYDLVTMTNGPWTRKDRCLFLFNDLLVITSISKRAARDVRRGAVNVSTLSNLLDHCRQKLWMYVSLEDVEISKAKEEHLKKMLKENKQIEEDINTLRIIGEATSRLHCPHKDLDDETRQLITQLTRQLSERQNSDTQQSMYLDLSINTSDGTETISLIFADSERRSQWEEVFSEAKQKLVRSDDKKSPPDFMTLIAIRKTRSGLQFTSAAPTLSLNAHRLKDVWVCNSDGYVGQVCVLSLVPEPTVICCNGVCNARILSIVSVPNIPKSSTNAVPHSSSEPTNLVNRSNSSEFPSASKYSHDDEGTPTKNDPKTPPNTTDLGTTSVTTNHLDSSSSEFDMKLCRQRHQEEEEEEEDSSSSSSSEDENVEVVEVVSPPPKPDAVVPQKKRSYSGPPTKPTVLKTSSSANDIALAAAANGGSTRAQNLSSLLVMSPSPIFHDRYLDRNHLEEKEGEEDASGSETPSFSNEESQATMWLGTEDGHIHVYNCTDNIRIKKNKEKFVHTSPVLCLIYTDNKVLASLGNGNVIVYSRSMEGEWDKAGAKVIAIGTQTHPVKKMIVVGGTTTNIWCAVRNRIKVLDPESGVVEKSFEVDEIGEENPRSILTLCSFGLAVWVTLEGSAKVMAFHTHRIFDSSKQPTMSLVEFKVTGVVNKVLTGCDDIIRQHKSACLRITSLLAVKDILWIGTSAGVIVTMHLPYISQNMSKITQVPPLIGNPHGHSGHVRFLTSVEMNPESIRSPFAKSGTRHSTRNSHNNTSSGKNPNESSNKGANVQGSPLYNSKVLVISGGDGYENFSNSSASEAVGREDSTNHLLIWQI